MVFLCWFIGSIEFFFLNRVYWLHIGFGVGIYRDSGLSRAASGGEFGCG